MVTSGRASGARLKRRPLLAFLEKQGKTEKQGRAGGVPGLLFCCSPPKGGTEDRKAGPPARGTGPPARGRWPSCRRWTPGGPPRDRHAGRLQDHQGHDLEGQLALGPAAGRSSWGSGSGTGSGSWNRTASSRTVAFLPAVDTRRPPGSGSARRPPPGPPGPRPGGTARSRACRRPQLVGLRAYCASRSCCSMTSAEMRVASKCLSISRRAFSKSASSALASCIAELSSP